jgi:hypothetical protein
MVCPAPLGMAQSQISLLLSHISSIFHWHVLLRLHLKEIFDPWVCIFMESV